MLSGYRGAKLWDPGYKVLKNFGGPLLPPPSSLLPPPSPLPRLFRSRSCNTYPRHSPFPSYLLSPLSLSFLRVFELWLMIGPTGYEVLEDRTLISIYL